MNRAVMATLLFRPGKQGTYLTISLQRPGDWLDWQLSIRAGWHWEV